MKDIRHTCVRVAVTGLFISIYLESKGFYKQAVVHRHVFNDNFLARPGPKLAGAPLFYPAAST
jgi:hypothetical protein